MAWRRNQLVSEKLDLRQPDLTVLLEQVHKPHNFSAILRSCDAVGVHTAHAVPPVGGLPLSTHTSQGAEKWVAVQRHRDVETAAQRLRDKGLRLVAAHLGEGATDFRKADLTRPVAVVLGTERHGVSEAALAVVDELITIPMQGMVASLNVSVAGALILFEAQRQRLAAGLYSRRRLDEQTYARTRFEWLHPKIARYCREHALDYPPLDEDGQIAGKIRGMASNPWPTRG